MYQRVSEAVDAVHRHGTGFEGWDRRKELESPADLTGWEFGVPEMLV